MKVFIPRKTLSEGISLLERVIPSRSANPLFTYLGLEVRPQALVLFGTNGEVDLEVRLPADGEGEGRALVPAQPFFQIVRSLPGEGVEASFAQELLLSSGSFQTRLGLAPVEGYPELLFPEPTKGGEGPFPVRTQLPLGEFLKALAHVRYAASNEEYRAIFRGVQLEFGSKGVRAVASDGYRLALYDLAEPQPFERKAVVPARSVDEMVRALRGVQEAGEVHLALGPGMIGVSGGAEGGLSVRMAARLMEGEFPDYERVVPKEFALKVALEADPFREALRRVSVLSDRQNHRVDLLFTEGSKLLLSAEGDYGRSQEELSVAFEGTPLLVAYNARYLLEALGPVEGGVELLISGPTSPSLLQAGGGYRAVVAPLRV
ncbi:DNA polymerase III, beta subunit [Thermus oshimai JL-2]|uniref:Beta sliding clamp n=1 Tax=Thermus oshimai JL-2 TaxID=751945 RepID=K7QXG1_THEOS|nr:DNA polymerase III subunit beta [Thermus oshimai]AFV75090.1 DNA polymerase III, beta subunit [Thermus oshimai JL-2]